MTAQGGGGEWSAVLFDLDGTLADTVELILRCYRHTMETHLGRVLPDERWLSKIGTPLRDQLREFARDDDEAARMLDTYVTFQRGVHDEMVEAFPGALEAVRGLQERGVPVAVVTSKRRETALRTLARCGFDGGYDLLVTVDDVTRGKPDPEPVRLALERLGVDRRVGHALMVGDSPWDLRAGRGAGTRTAAALWGPYARAALEAEAPDFWLQSPAEVLRLEP